MGTVVGFLEWLKGERAHVRRAKRYLSLGISAYYWEGGEPIGHGVRDLSMTGAYLYTSERLYIGTILRLTLQQNAEGKEATEAQAADSISVPCRVVRIGKDGVGLAFMLDKPKSRKTLEEFVKHALRDRELTASAPAKDTEGQALIEYALIIPLLFFLMANAINFGGFIYAWITVANAARSGAQYAILGGPSIGYPAIATSTQLTDLVKADVFSLLNGNAPTLNICRNNNGTTTTVTGTCSGVPADPEAPSFVLTTVDVSYTYKPLIPMFNFSGLGIGLPSFFPTAGRTVHRRVLMRSIQ